MFKKPCSFKPASCIFLLSLFMFPQAFAAAETDPGGKQPSDKAADAEHKDKTLDTPHDKEKVKQLIQQLGDNNYSVRESAAKQLKNMGAEIIPDLEKAHLKSTDPEVQLRTEQIIQHIYRVVIFENLSDEEIEIAELEFKNNTKESSEDSVKRHTYPSGSYGITDIGNIRIAVKELELDGESESDIMTRPAKDKITSNATGSGNSRFSHNCVDGVTYCKWAGVMFNFKDGKMNVGDSTLEFKNKPQIIFVSADGKVEKVFELKAQRPEKKE